MPSRSESRTSPPAPPSDAEGASTKAYWARLKGRVAKRLSFSQNAEDRLHSAYVRMAEREGEPDNAGAFLVRSAVNLDIDEFRRTRSQNNVPIEPFEGVLDEPSPLQDEVLIARERLARVRAGLTAMSPRTREAFLMHRLGGMKYREIAQALDISQSAVEKHIAKAAHFLAEWTEGW